MGEIFYKDRWANCTSYTGEMLMKLGAYLEEGGLIMKNAGDR